MFVSSVASIQHTGFQMTSQQMRSPRSSMATDDHVDSHCLNRQRGVDECLAFGKAAGTGRKVDRIRAKSASGEAETGASSGGVFEKQIGNDNAFQHVQSLRSAKGDSIIVFREIQNGGQLFGRQSLQPQQVPFTPRPAHRKIIEYHHTPFRSRLTFSCLSGESICIRDPIQFTANPLCGFPQQGQRFRSQPNVLLTLRELGSVPIRFW